MNSNFDLNTTGQHQTITPQQYMISQSAQDVPKFNGRAIKQTSNTGIYPEKITPTSNDFTLKNYRKISSADTAHLSKTTNGAITDNNLHHLTLASTHLSNHQKNTFSHLKLAMYHANKLTNDDQKADAFADINQLMLTEIENGGIYANNETTPKREKIFNLINRYVILESIIESGIDNKDSAEKQLTLCQKELHEIASSATAVEGNSKTQNNKKPALSLADTVKQDKMLPLEMLRQFSGTQAFCPNSQNTDKNTDTKTTDDEEEFNNIEIGDVFEFNRFAEEFSKQIKKASTQKDTDITLAELSYTLKQLNNLKNHYLLDGNIDYLIQNCNHEINKITLNTIESSKSSNQPELSKEQKIQTLRFIQNSIQQLSHHSSIEDSELLERCERHLELLESPDQSSWCTII